MSDTRKRAASLPASPSITRRSVLLAAGGAAALAACGDDDGGGDVSDGQTQGQATDETPDETPSSPDDSGDDAGSGDGDDSSGGDALAAVDEVPVGGGAVFADEEIVVVQPEEGEFKAYTAICKHQGCPLDAVEDGQILCSQTCGHGSTYAIEDGSNVQGPATAPLDEVPITVEGGSIVTG